MTMRSAGTTDEGELSALTLPASAREVPPGRRSRSVGIGRAHAKAILLGEHAVVYGAAALALPIPQLTVTATAGRSPHTHDGEHDLSYTMTGSPSRALVTRASDGLRRLTEEFTTRTGITNTPHLDVILDGAIPHGRGLGSSAATSRAIVLALADLFDSHLDEHTIYELVQTAENMAHGRASGVDATAVGAPRPLAFQAGRAHDLTIGCDGLFIIADSGTPGSTKEAVERLREGFTHHPTAERDFINRATHLTETGQQALADGHPETLGAQLTAYHELLASAGLSTTRIDALVSAALNAGSLGAKITGGGLGGCIIAQTRPEQASNVTRRLHQAGAIQTWVVPLKGLDNHAR